MSPQIPDGWRIARLGDVLRLEYGVPLPERDRLPGDTPVIGSAGVIGFHSQATHAGPAVVVGRKGSIGTVTWVPVDCVPIDTTYCALPVEDRLADLRWIYRVLDREDLAGLNRATGVPGLNRDDVHALNRLIPPVGEQRAIAAVLDSIDEAIESADEVIAATERLRDALLHELLTRGLPGQHSEWNEVPGLGTIPASWKVIRLGDVAEVRSGQVDPRDPALQHLQFVAPDDIETATGRLILRRRVSDAGAISGKYEFDEHDVIYSKIRPYLMKVYLPKNRGLCSADMYPIRPRGGLTRNYLALVLVSPSFTDYTRTCSDRTGIPKINRTDLLRFQLRLPSQSEQRAIGAVFDSVDAAIERARAERCDLRSLQASTADALLTGRVRVDQRDAIGQGPAGKE